MELARRQFNRVSRRQLIKLGMSEKTLVHRVETGRLVPVEQGVFALGPVLDHDPWGRWTGATLTHPGTLLSHLSSAVAWGVLSNEGPLITVTRPGSGGPRRHGGLMVHRSKSLRGDWTDLHGILITVIARTLLDLGSTGASDRALARAVREAVRLERITLYGLGDALGRYRGRRGAGRLASVVARYSGLPLERAKSGAEVRAMELLRDAGDRAVRLNHRIAGEEADLSWPSARLVIEIDGAPFHQDVGEDARKQAAWESAGWTVLRISSDEVYGQPGRLLALASHTNVPRLSL
jgi:very-short-patch-repair endonuclease